VARWPRAPLRRATPGRAAAPQPPNAYAAFRERLRHPSAQPVLAELLGFVRDFPAQLPRAEAARRVHRFISGTLERMLSDVAVFAAEAGEEGRASTVEGLEKFVLTRLYPRLFAADPADAAEEAKLQRRIGSLSWVGFRHLGVPPVDPALLDLAVQELQRIDSYKAPRDKLVCVLNACRVINNVLQRTMTDSGAAPRPLSADDFLPLLISAVLAAKALRLHCNVEFVACFRHPSRLVAEDAYFLTALQSAIAFVRSAGPKALDVAPEEFERLCSASLAESEGGAAGGPGGPGEGLWPLGAAVAAGAGAATVADKARELGPAERRRLGERLAALTLSFENVTSAQQLRIQDVDVLLDEYREMARLLHDVEDGKLRS